MFTRPLSDHLLLRGVLGWITINQGCRTDYAGLKGNKRSLDGVCLKIVDAVSHLSLSQSFF